MDEWSAPWPRSFAGGVSCPSLSYRKVIACLSSTLDFTLGVSYFRVRRQLDLSHVDPRVGPDRTVAAREAGNLVVVYLPSAFGRRVDPPLGPTGGSSFGTPLTCRPIYGFSRMGSVRGRLSSSRWVSLSYFDSTRWRFGAWGWASSQRRSCPCVVRVRKGVCVTVWLDLTCFYGHPAVAGPPAYS